MTRIQGWQVAGKSWAALIGSLLAVAIPALVQASHSMSAPWPAVIGAVVAVLTAIGVYQAPSQPVAPRHSGVGYRNPADADYQPPRKYQPLDGGCGNNR